MTLIRWLALVLWLAPYLAQAEDLVAVYRDALRYDAQYAAARHTLDAGREKLPQGIIARARCADRANTTVPLGDVIKHTPYRKKSFGSCAKTAACGVCTEFLELTCKSC